MRHSLQQFLIAMIEPLLHLWRDQHTTYVFLLNVRQSERPSDPAILPWIFISPEVAGTLLFLIAEAAPDAAEMAKQIRWTGQDPVEMRLLSAIADLANGRLERIVSPAMPSTDALVAGDPGASATRSLYFLILAAVRSLAREILDGGEGETGSAMTLFSRAITLAVLVFSLSEVELLPSISVLTPERCLAMLGYSPDVFTDVGLIVFDECHLLHPRDLDTSRRSIDAMLCPKCPSQNLLNHLNRL